MPISDFGSYKTTGDEFDVHWQDVNADRAANTLPEFELPDGYKVADLQADVAEVDAAVTLVDSVGNDLDQATKKRAATTRRSRTRRETSRAEGCSWTRKSSASCSTHCSTHLKPCGFSYEEAGSNTATITRP